MAPVSKPLARLSSRLRRPKSLLAALGASAIVALAIAPTAGATSLRMSPTFECYSYHGTASITIDKLQVQEDGRATAWGAAVWRWNGRSWGTRPYWTSRASTFNDGDSNQGDSSFGQVLEQPISVRVAANSYYAVEDLMKSTGDRSVQHAWASPMVGRYNSTACHT